MTFTPSEASDVLARIDAQLDVVNVQRDRLMELRQAVVQFMDEGGIQQPGSNRSDSEAPRARASSVSEGNSAPASQPERGERRPDEASGPGSATTRVRASSPPAQAGPFPCPEPGCGRTFAKPHGLHIHRIRMHPVDDSLPSPPAAPGNGVRPATTYLCDRCPKSFDSRETLEAHRATHADTPAPAGIRQHAADRFAGE